MSTRSRASRSPQDILIGAPAFDAVIVEEVARKRRGRAQVIAPGVVSVTSSQPLNGLVFARQSLPQALRIEAGSASELADSLVRALDDDEDAWLSGALQFDVDVSDGPRAGSRPRDDHPLAEGLAHLVEILEKKRLGRARKQGIAAEGGLPTERREFLLVGAWWGLLSAPHVIGEALTTWPVPFAAGRASVVTDKSAPSSAHRKLDEALCWVKARPTPASVVLDLGAAPGGWTHVALRHGASVVAVDRGEMDPSIMASGRVTHLRKDAFEHAPLLEADWIVCDIIAEPARTLELVERALTSTRLEAFVITVKLREPIDFSIVERAQKILDEHPEFLSRAKNLFHNKVEFTLMGRRGPRA